MRNRLIWMLAVAMMLAAGTAYSGTAVQMWNCGIEGDVEEEDIESQAAEWLTAAKGVDGGANLEAYVLFPVAVNATGETDFLFVVTAPTFAEWGRFWDAYPESDAADREGDGIFCPDSVIWDSTKIE